ncbi:hypothetical protein [uncultured Dokdonia sp.]|uniref:hypothetical protein n=1 Tax=uncultured Dokdonia sp. TaxID=575653 RepID=UPI00263597B4|nr:hypothetical protein [uncultured Dokdonia sp.]
MKTINFLTILLSFSITVTAQQSFFETIDAHGPNARYQVYGDLYKNDKGEPAAQEVTTYKNTIEKHQHQGLPSGFTINKVLDNGKTALSSNYNGISISAIKYVGFPNTSILHHTGYNRGYVAFDNYVFFLHGISKDQTSFSEIRSIMILDGSASKTGKKKKKGKFWKQLKEAALNERPNGEGSSPEYKELMAKDPEKLVREYLKKMKAKQDTYVMTSQDEKNLKILYNGAKADDAYAKKKNDEYWASEEGQAILKNRATIDKMEAEHLRTCRLAVCDNSAHN